jgi:hypothetical protein
MKGGPPEKEQAATLFTTFQMNSLVVLGTTSCFLLYMVGKCLELFKRKTKSFGMLCRRAKAKVGVPSAKVCSKKCPSRIPYLREVRTSSDFMLTHHSTATAFIRVVDTLVSM